MIESWNVQHLFEKEFREASQISSHSAHSDNCYFHFFYPLSDRVEILWGFIFKQMLKISDFYVEKQKKSFIPKKKSWFRP